MEQILKIFTLTKGARNPEEAIAAFLKEHPDYRITSHAIAMQRSSLFSVSAVVISVVFEKIS